MQKRGFSLMEMMVVMLIVAVIAAATAPMINKKMIQNASGESPWIWTSAVNNSIAFNMRGNSNSPAVIGAVKPPTDLKTMLHINTNDTGKPLMTFSTKDAKENLRLYFQDAENRRNLWLNSADMPATGVSNSLALGIGSKALSSSVAVGTGATGSGVAVGTNANAQGAIALGINVTAKQDSILIGRGYSETVAAIRSVAVGTGASTKDCDDSIAIGYSASALKGSETTVENIAVGHSAKATDTYSIAIGGDARAYLGGVAIGGSEGGIDLTDSEKNSYYKYSSSFPTTTFTIAKKNAIAIGNGIQAIGENSIALGSIDKDVNYNYAYITKTEGKNSIAIGNIAYAKGENSIVIGGGGVDSNPGGFNPSYASKNGIAIGRAATSTGESSIAIGTGTKSTGESSIAIGNATASNESSIAIGNATASNESSIAIGNATASGQYSTAIGYSASAKHGNSTAIGYNAETTASNQIVLGNNNATVYIKGNLVVDGVTVLGRNKNSYLVLRTPRNKRITTINESATDYDLRHANANGSVPNVDDSNPLGYTSDRRLKKVGEVFKAGLNEVKKLEVFNYTFKKDPEQTPRVGVMAQDLEKIFPNAVFKGDDGFLRIRMEDMFYAVVNAVKELDAKLTALVEEVKTAIADITDLKIKSAEYEKTIAELVEQNKAQAKALKDLEKRLAKLEKKALKEAKKQAEEVVEEIEE